MKICLVGSSRFKELYDQCNRRLTLAGHVVYSIAMVSTGDRLKPEEKEVLDLVHLMKIQESEAVFLVTDASGYYGDSTRRELTWARILNKHIFAEPNSLEYLCETDAFPH